MIGVSNFSCYLPKYRLKRDTIVRAMGWFNPAIRGVAHGEKSVTSFDEDSLTMAVAAGRNCLASVDRGDLDALFLASTTLPYLQRENAGIARVALGLKPEIRTADYRDSLKCGTAALLGGLEALKAEQIRNVLVCVTDCRLGKMASMQEQFYGDGSAALILGDTNIVAEFMGSHSISHDFPDYVRTEGKVFDRSWEERWIINEGYNKVIPQIVSELLDKYNLNVDDLAKVIYPCHFKRAHLAIAKRIGIQENQLQSNLHETVGDTGAAHPLIMFLAALEDARPGDKMLVISYGNGSDAILFEVTDRINALKDHGSLSFYLERKRELKSYEKYTVFRGLAPVDVGIRGESVQDTVYSMLWRKREAVLGLVGNKCKACGTPQFPPGRVCINPECGTIDQMEPYRFSDRRGEIFSYTGDLLGSSYDPPNMYGLVDLEGGGRLFVNFTDCKLDELKIGLPVEMTFRRKYLDEQHGITGYFWKATLV